jgi:Spy/CpxP family protein refolding chaperone
MNAIPLIAALTTVSILGASPSWAQSHQPYAGLQSRPIKALSDEQLADLRAGRGMGLALAAELNGYPGPLHVIQLADALALTAPQRDRMQTLFETMRAEAVALGDRLITEEAELERQFATRTVTPASLNAATAAIGRTQAELRAAHLRYHLMTVEVLTPHQVRRYIELRGYAGAAPEPQHRPGMHHR